MCMEGGGVMWKVIMAPRTGEASDACLCQCGKRSWLLGRGDQRMSRNIERIWGFLASFTKRGAKGRM